MLKRKTRVQFKLAIKGTTIYVGFLMKDKNFKGGYKIQTNDSAYSISDVWDLSKI